MAKLFKGKYGRKSTRLPYWDYGTNASYFVTMCTKHRIFWFGDINDGQMILSEIGAIANQCWLEIPEHFPFVKLGQHIVMPDHIHGIIIIDKPVGAEDFGAEGAQDFGAEGAQDFGAEVGAQDFVPQQRLIGKNKFGAQSKNLASIVRGFKVGVTKYSRKIHRKFEWQSRYYDHIIRDEKSFKRISNYIINNPINSGRKRR